jgi:hypothetical protein
MIKFLKEKRRYSEEMYQRWVSGLIGFGIDIIVFVIWAITDGFK